MAASAVRSYSLDSKDEWTLLIQGLGRDGSTGQRENTQEFRDRQHTHSTGTFSGRSACMGATKLDMALSVEELGCDRNW